MSTRPAGVTASGIVCIFGSILVLGIASMLLTTAYLGDATPRQFRPLVLGMGVFSLALALLGLWTGIALLRLRPRGRTTALVLGGVMAAFAALSLVTVTVIPMPQDATLRPDSWRIVRAVMAGLYAIPLGVGVWWLVYFNRPSTRAAFAAGADGLVESGRPLSISIMGWASIVGGVSTLFAVIVPLPAFLFGAVLTGWAAKVVYFSFAVVSTYMGWALLRLREHGRLLALGWCAFAVVHSAVTLLVPSARAHLRDLSIAGQTLATPGNPQPFMTVMFFAMLALTAVAVWYLVRAKPAFTAGSTS